MPQQQESQFGIVRAGTLQFAIPIAHLSEVFHAQNEQSLPQRSKYLRGGIELRDRLIPLLDLKSLAELDEGNTADELGVIIDANGRQLGIFVDEIIGISTITADAIESIHPQNQKTAGAFGQYFRYNENYTSIIDVAAIFALPGVFTAPRAEVERAHEAKTQASSLTFRAGGAIFSVPAVEVYAAIPKQEIKRTAIAMGPVLGEISYHGRRIPVLCPIEVFGLGEAQTNSASEVVALRFPDNTVLGFAVDAIQKIGIVTSGARTKLPDWCTQHGFIREILIHDDDKQVFGLCTQTLTEAAALCEIAKLSKPDDAERPEATRKSDGMKNIVHEKTRYLVVEAARRIAIPLSEVNRIIDVPKHVTRTREQSGGFEGYFAKTGQTIALFDLAACQGGARADTDQAKILLTGEPDQQSGFEVSKVVGIELAEWREVLSDDPDVVAPPVVQLGGGENAVVLPICSLVETLDTQKRQYAKTAPASFATV